MNRTQRLQRAVQGAIEARRLWDQRFPEQERREAARGLGIESWLPDPEQLPLYEPKEEAHGR